MRGLAAISIIAIHTAFWSGQRYTPEWFQNITLFIDVPFFFYLSGWGSSYTVCDIIKTCKSLMKIWIKWIFFVTVIAVFCGISTYLPYNFSGITSIRDLINNYMFNVSISGFSVIAGSIWFMPYYFVIVFLNVLFMMFIKENANSEKLKLTYMWILLVGFIWTVYGKYILGLDLGYFFFYSFFWMLGMNRYGKCKNLQTLFVTLIFCALGIVFLSYLQDLSIYDIQSAKFPPSPKYLCVSLISIFIFKFLEDKVLNFNSIIVHIGRNAIWYYFGQGIGSSIIFYVVDKTIVDVWILKWILVYMINLLITVAIAESFAWCFQKIIVENKSLNFICKY